MIDISHEHSYNTEKPPSTQASGSPRNPPNTPPRPLAQNLHLTLLLQTPNRIRKLGPLDRDRTTLAQRPDNIPIPHTPVPAPKHIIKNPKQTSLQILPPLPLTSARALSQQSHVDQTGPGVGGGLFESGLDEADGFGDVVFGHG